MSFIEIAIIAGLAAAVFFALRHMIGRKKSGCSCCGDCGSCGGCSCCGR